MAQAQASMSFVRVPYVPYGAARQVWQCKARRVLAHGPAGTGKTHGNLQKLHAAACKYPGMRGLIIRKVKADLAEVLKDFEEEVLHNYRCASHDGQLCNCVGGLIKLRGGENRAMRSMYQYPNGSEIVVGGMNKASRIMGPSYDMIVGIESTELTEEDVDNLASRLRNFVMPYQQMILDCNPRQPQHHLWRGANATPAKYVHFPSTHKDNPKYYDQDAGDWTPAGREYVLGTLNDMTGVRRDWFLEGKWTTAEGAVYDFSEALHVIKSGEKPFRIPDDWRRIRVIDFGFTNPFVCQWWAIDPDGRMYMYREIYRTRRIVAEHAKEILRLSEGERIEATVCDHDAEDRATLEAAGIPTIPGLKAVVPGIQKVMARLRPAADGKPRLYLIEGALVETDRELDAKKLPRCTREEFDSYIYPTAKEDRPFDEHPVKLHDHGCFVGETLVETPDGPRRIDSIRVGDLVSTPVGPRAVVAAEQTANNAPVLTLRTRGGRTVTGTADHPIWTDRGFVRMDELRHGDIIAAWQSPAPKLCSTVAASTVDIPTRKIGQAESISETVADSCTFKSGGTTTERSSLGCRFTTKTATPETTISQILKWCRRKNTPKSISRRRRKKDDAIKPIGFDTLQPHGIHHQRVKSGTLSTPKRSLETGSRFFASAITARRHTKLGIWEGTDSVPTTAKTSFDTLAASMTRPEHAPNAERRFESTSVQRQNVALDAVEAVTLAGYSPVFNVAVEGERVYFAGGILVSNCDALRMGVAYLDGLDDAVRVFPSADVGNVRHAIESPIYIGALRFSPQATALGRDDYLRAKTVCGGWADDSEGPWRLWVPLTKDQSGRYRPPQSATYIIGCALSMTTNGYEAAVCVSRRETREQVAEAILTGEDATPDQLARLLSLAGYWFGGRDGDGCGFMLWEGNTPGTAMGRQLTKLSYPWMYYHADTDKRNAKPGDKYGWQPNPDRAQRLLIETRRLIATGEYRLRSDETAEACGRLVMHNSGVGLWDTKDHADLRDGGIERARAVALALSANGMEMCAAIDPPKRKAEKGTVAYAAEQLRKQEADKARGWWNRT